MRAFALTWDAGFKNLMVATCPNLDDAKAAVESARSDAGIAVEQAVDFDKSGPALVALYAAVANLADVPPPYPSRFATRSDGQARVFGLLELHFKDAPEAAAPPPVDDSAATPETESKEDDMASKGKKATKKTKAAPAAKKAPKPKKDGGAKALVREESSRGKLLKIAVENAGISLKALASRAGVSGEGSMDAVGRTRMRLRKVAENVGGTVSFDGDKVTFDLPKTGAGSSLDKIFGR